MLKKTIYVLGLSILCFSMFSCGKSPEEKAMDDFNKSMKDFNKSVKDLGY